jgi:hypothetical protein
MNHEIQPLLKLFYFGSIEENERLKVERELLTDPEALLDYLDLKRKLEAALEVPQFPSQRLWLRLKEKIEPRKRMIFSLSIGAAIAASLLIFSILTSKPRKIDQKSSGSTEVLFDSSRELPVSSNVL